MTKPATVADDIGVDFACTLFDPLRERGRTVLLPQVSFAVQVKSSRRTVSLSKHREYLDRLELPYYIAVADRRRLQLDLYSGRCLPFALAFRGPSIRSLTATLVKDGTVLFKNSVEGGRRQVRVRMPHLASVSANATATQLSDASARLAADCLESSLNIAHKRVGQFVFSALGGTDRAVLAGSRSARVFRQSFSDRLTEYCRNLAFIDDNRNRGPTNREIRAVLSAIDGLRDYLPRSTLRDRAAARLREILLRRGANGS